MGARDASRALAAVARSGDRRRRRWSRTDGARSTSTSSLRRRTFSVLGEAGGGILNSIVGSIVLVGLRDAVRRAHRRARRDLRQRARTAPRRRRDQARAGRHQRPSDDRDRHLRLQRDRPRPGPVRASPARSRSQSWGSRSSPARPRRSCALVPTSYREAGLALGAPRVAHGSRRHPAHEPRRDSHRHDARGRAHGGRDRTASLHHLAGGNDGDVGSQRSPCSRCR